MIKRMHLNGLSFYLSFSVYFDCGLVFIIIVVIIIIIIIIIIINNNNTNNII